MGSLRGCQASLNETSEVGYQNLDRDPKEPQAFRPVRPISEVLFPGNAEPQLGPEAAGIAEPAERPPGAPDRSRLHLFRRALRRRENLRGSHGRHSTRPGGAGVTGQSASAAAERSRTT